MESNVTQEDCYSASISILFFRCLHYSAGLLVRSILDVQSGGALRSNEHIPTHEAIDGLRYFCGRHLFSNAEGGRRSYKFITEAVI